MVGEASSSTSRMGGDLPRSGVRVRVRVRVRVLVLVRVRVTGGGGGVAIGHEARWRERGGLIRSLGRREPRGGGGEGVIRLG